MKKILPIFLVVVLLIIGFDALAQPEFDYIVKESREIISFSKPVIKETENKEYTIVELNESTSMITKAGEPILPTFCKKYILPLGTKIQKVDVIFSGERKIVLAKKIMPAPTPIPILENENIEYKDVIEETVYTSNKSFPAKQFEYNIYSGLNGTKHVLILNIRCFPIQYIPNNNTIYTADKIDIRLTYILPRTPIDYPNKYDLVIIAPQKFSHQLQPLIKHKNLYGLNTTLKTTNEIYKEYIGRDNPEKIKYYIKDAVEKIGVNYVLLVGGLKSSIWARARDDKNQGTKDWYVPVRYSNLREDSGICDPGFITDLYYADIYKVVENNTVFDDWDSNGNNIFGEWQGKSIDEIDLYPDVYVGRLACRNTFEVKIMVNKIIKYESTSADPSWFNRMIVIGGDSHYDPKTNFIEGEMVCNKALSYMPDFEPIKLYASNRENSKGLTPTPKNISRQISKGAGFVFFDGHGNPASWNTHWYGEYSWDNTPGGISIARFPILSNGAKLPITLIGGCHNSQINVTLFATLLDRPYMWTYGVPVPECFSWWLARKIGGGSIASIGSTGLGYGYVGNHSDVDGDGVDEPDNIEGLGGYIGTTFFKKYSEGIHILGEVWGGTIFNYLDAFPPMDDKIQIKCIQEWVLLGDPSLMIGGYQD